MTDALGREKIEDDTEHVEAGDKSDADDSHAGLNDRNVRSMELLWLN